MARKTLRNLAISGAAALSFATVSTPSTNATLSRQHSGNAQDSAETYNRLHTEAVALAREYNEIDFQSKSLQNAQQAIALNKENPTVTVRELEKMNAALQDRIAARKDRQQKFHDELLNSPHISEAAAQALYTGPYEGTAYAYYYTETMAYRDECKRDTDCMTRMDDSEGSRKLAAFTQRAGLSFAAAFSGLFGFGAAGGLVGNWRRRRTEKQHRDRLADARDMLKPKGR